MAKRKIHRRRVRLHRRRPKIVCVNHESYSLGDKILVYRSSLELRLGDEAVIGNCAYPVARCCGEVVELSDSPRRLSPEEQAEVFGRCKWHGKKE